MKYLSKKLLLNALPLITVIGLNAAIFTGPDGGNWGEATNWDTGIIPTVSEDMVFSLAEDRTINMDSDYAIKSISATFAAGDLSIGGSGNLTIDVNSATAFMGIAYSVGNSGGILDFKGNITFNNTGGARTIVRTANSASNIIRFSPGSNLTLTTALQTQATAKLGRIEFNGNVSGLAIAIGSPDVVFGAGHDSTGLSEVVFFANAMLTVNGGTVLNSAGKFQVNGINAVMNLNSANSINGARISIGGSNALTVNINANQESLGLIALPASGSLTLNVDPAVTNVSFISSYFQNWGTGTVTLTGFKENTIRFGTDGVGLTRTHLDAINGGIYSLTSDGYLTEATIERWARFEIDANNLVSLSPWIELDANVEFAPYLEIDQAGWMYIDELVGVNGNGWVFAYDLEVLNIAPSGDANYGYSVTLESWVYFPYDVAAETAAWLYLF